MERRNYIYCCGGAGMEVKGLLKALAVWEIEKEKTPKVIKISPQKFHELASDKESLKYLGLFEDDKGIICHKFIDLPLVITKEVETLEIV
jgi:hypothetical protein